MIFFRQNLPSKEKALQGRNEPLCVNNLHHVHQRTIKPPFPKECQLALFGLGCFWGAERIFWIKDGVYTTAVGYAGGYTPNPTYEEVCSGLTGHAEVVLIVFDPTKINYLTLLKTFWEGHDPTQGMQQQNDIGTQYRSCIYTYNEAQKKLATNTKNRYGEILTASNKLDITTEIKEANTFYYAEDHHQQYLSKNPGGYCGLGSTGFCLEMK